ncbi:MAG: response regulator [Phenylobacterium sp.]|uniref:hybrid sensor histidine kinase/response regulator n=1 Tax=Phenylobacterium sp. TaxID=1871053 RepID=UPI001229DFB6|nr:ATP-binding protein [Phenylobacterium sp.]TAJ73835.1 MAG: response regulator [Phenylobacterium sp.]
MTELAPLDRWRSPNAVMGLAVAAALIVLAACVALVFYADEAVNHLTSTREATLMQRAIAHRQLEVAEDVRIVSMWTDGYERTARRFDVRWVEINYGHDLQRSRKHDLTVLFDARDRPIYAAKDGDTVPPDAVAAFTAAARPVLAAARRQSEAKVAANPDAMGFDRQGSAMGAVTIGGRAYLAAAATVTPEPHHRDRLLATPLPVIVSAVEVNGEFLRWLAQDYGLKDARVIIGEGAGPSAPLASVDGAPVAAIGWRPDLLGHAVFRQAAPQILGFGVAVICVAGLLILRVRRLAREVVTARDLAEAGGRAKSEFIANMSHEIRTPLNGVLGMAQAMDMHELSPDQRERLRVIRESGSTLLALLNDVLDLSKLQAGKLEMEEAIFDLEAVGRQVCATFGGLAAEKGLALTLEVDEAVRGAWIGDALRIRQVLSNLVANAVKFTASGSVTLAMEPCGAHVCFAVIDTGIGLDAASIPHLFDKFAQADASTTRRYGGTGLGLAICQELVELMGGAIKAVSQPGKGSRFAFSLPLVRGPAGAEALAPDAAPAEPPRRLRVLAAEDNPTNQLVLRALLEPLEAEVTLAGNGREAVAAYAAGAFDVVLMDVQMPEMNGLDATRAIRALEAQRGVAPTPVLALTANVMRHQLDSYLAAGMDGHIAKPLDIASLYAALDAALGSPAAAQAA